MYNDGSLEFRFDVPVDTSGEQHVNTVVRRPCIRYKHQLPVVKITPMRTVGNDGSDFRSDTLVRKPPFECFSASREVGSAIVSDPQFDLLQPSFRHTV